MVSYFQVNTVFSFPFYVYYLVRTSSFGLHPPCNSILAMWSPTYLISILISDISHATCKDITPVLGLLNPPNIHLGHRSYSSGEFVVCIQKHRSDRAHSPKDEITNHSTPVTDFYQSKHNVLPSARWEKCTFQLNLWICSGWRGLNFLEFRSFLVETKYLKNNVHWVISPKKLKGRILKVREMSMVKLKVRHAKLQIQLILEYYTPNKNCKPVTC